MSQITAVSSEGPTLESMVDPRFGRAAGFLIITLPSMESKYIDNGSSQAMAKGAGIQAAEIIANAGATCLLTGVVGPKAETALATAGVTVYQGYENITVAEAILRFQKSH